MFNSDEHRCPNCNSTDLVSVQTTAIDADLLECRSCIRLYKVETAPDGTSGLVPV
jgi:hypothetical protein